MDPEELKERTMVFALRIGKLVEALPRSRVGRLVEDQLGRAGTSVGSNYRAACKARSRREFIAKIGIVEEEADESAYWLEYIGRYGLLAATRVGALQREAVELGKIFARSRITASTNERISQTNRPRPSNRQ